MERIVETPNLRRGFISRSTGFNILLYVFTLILVVLFIYFIYKFIYGGTLTASNIIFSDQIIANDSKNYKYNVAIPSIYDGGEFSLNFWIYISGYNYRQGQRKHLVEIGGSKFSTILVALGANKPSLLTRVHTMDLTPEVSGNNYGITDCSGSDASDCSGGTLNGFQQITDTNIMNTMKNNSLTKQDIASFFKPMQVDENSLIHSESVCDVKELPLQKWVNVAVVMNSHTLDIYLDGKLVKTCVYDSYYKVDNSSGGVTLTYLAGSSQIGFDGYMSRLQVLNTALNPDDIYKTYLAGPQGSSATSDPVSFLKYIFTG
jgi:hypothetical protein